MGKVDLDDVEKYMIGYVDSGKVRELIALFPDLIAELKAAREFIEFARYYEEPHWHEYGRLLQNYDEATK